MRIIFLVILIDLIGFGMMIPIMPYFVTSLGGSETLATIAVGLYAAGMFVSTPVLGRISDYYGRRPVLILSLVGASASYMLLAVADSIAMVVASRILAGIMAGNLSAAQAYITDITTPENRAKGMGMIGAAFGLGFVIGPFMGSYMAGSEFETANLGLPAYVSASLSLLAALIVLVKLPESLDQAHRDELRAQPRVGRLAAFRKVSATPFILVFLVAATLQNVSAGLGETVFPLWTREVGVVMGPRDLGPMLFAAGLTLAIVQGGLIGPLTKRFGEEVLLRAGLLIFVASMLLIAWTGGLGSYYGVIAALCVQSVGAALAATSMQSLVSKGASPTERGMVMGLYSSGSTGGRALGAMVTGGLMATVYLHAPYLVAAGVTLSIFVMTIVWSRVIHRVAVAREEGVSHG